MLIGLAACGSPTPAASTARTQEQYTVRLHRPVTPDAKWHVVSDGSFFESSSTFTEQVVVKKSEKRVKAHFDAIATAVAVDAGTVSRVDYLITSFASDGRDVIPPGVHLVIEPAPKKDDTRIDVAGHPASADVREALDAVMQLTRDVEGEDVVFGTRTAQPIGGSWPVAVEPTKVLLARNGAVAKDEAISGRVTLAGKERIGTDDCLDIRVDLGIRAFTPTKPLPEGSQVTKGTLTLTLVYAVPLDVARGGRRSDLDAHTEFEAFIPVQNAETAGVTLTVRSDRRRTVETDPM